MADSGNLGRMITFGASLALVLGLAFAALVASPRQARPKCGFYPEMEASTATMHAAMHIEPTGDPDADFVTMMIPHHQGAIDMAEAILRHGRNERVRRIAQEIIIEQQQEIALMRLAVPHAPAAFAHARGRREETPELLACAGE